MPTQLFFFKDLYKDLCFRVFKNHHYGSPVIWKSTHLNLETPKIKVCVDACVFFFFLLFFFFWFLVVFLSGDLSHPGLMSH